MDHMEGSPMPSQSAPPRHRAKPWVRRRRLLLLFIALFMALFILFPAGFLAIARHFSEKRHEAQLAAIRDAGLPVTIDELENWIFSLPPTEEAPNIGEGDVIAHYAEVFGDFTRLEKEPGIPDINALLEILGKNGRLTDTELSDLRQCLAANEHALTLLLETANMPPGRFSLDHSKGYELELPHLVKLRQAARVLRGAAYAATLDGNPEHACNCILTGMSLRKSLRYEPLLMSQLVRFSINNIIVEALGDTIGLANYSDTQLAQFQNAFAGGHDPLALRNALVYERVIGMSMFDGISKALQSGNFFRKSFFPGPLSTIAHAFTAVGWFNGDRERFLDSMDVLIKTSTLPHPDAIAAMQQVATELERPTKLPSFTKLLVPGLCRAPEAMARNETQLLQAATVCAIERYRLANGAPPDTLDTLVPAYFPAVPIDPFDNQPMRYRREGTAYTLYSVNMDGVDDGGVAGENAREGDLVFRKSH